jgi:hypothetical protein
MSRPELRINALPQGLPKGRRLRDLFTVPKHAANGTSLGPITRERLSTADCATLAGDNSDNFDSLCAMNPLAAVAVPKMVRLKTGGMAGSKVQV